MIFIFAPLLAQSPEWKAILDQNNSLLASVAGRQAYSLDGKWDVIVDQQEIGFYNYRYKESDDGWFKDRQVEKPEDLIEYNFDRARKLNVPGDWNSQDEDLLRYEGTVWYRKVFDYELQSDKRYYLHFGAVNYEANVYLNGTKVGSHEGGFTPFNFEVTDLLQDGRNYVIVKVDNKRKREALPTVIFDWWNYGGITRSVHLIETPQTFIHNYFVQLDPQNDQQVKGWVKLNGTQGQQDVRLQVSELNVDQSVQTDANGFAEITAPINSPSYWSPASPKTYQVSLVAETDQITEPIGFRSLEVDGYDILLNGESSFLRGVCMHEESPYNPGRATSAEEARVQFGWAREMNANFLRLAHYPHNEHTTRTADEMGMMIWSEIPVYWVILWQNQATIDNARQQLREMINRDKNKASVVLWSVANETPLEEGRLEFLSGLVDYAKALDPTRLITAALENHMSEDGTKMIDDPLGEKLDVIGNNNYCGWYAGEPQSCGDLRWEMVYEKPLILSEFGGGALQGYRGEANQRWTEDFQAEVYRYNIEMLKEIPFLRGTTPWLLKDFRSPRRPLADIQDDYNRKGLISERGKKKAAFYLMKEYYQEVENQYDKR